MVEPMQFRDWDITHYMTIPDGLWIRVTEKTRLEYMLHLQKIKLHHARANIYIIVDLAEHSMTGLNDSTLRRLLNHGK